MTSWFFTGFFSFSNSTLSFGRRVVLHLVLNRIYFSKRKSSNDLTWKKQSRDQDTERIGFKFKNTKKEFLYYGFSLSTLWALANRVSG
jgi:hypothetical protein